VDRSIEVSVDRCEFNDIGIREAERVAPARITLARILAAFGKAGAVYGEEHDDSI
jgi:hypothetical protein